MDVQFPTALYESVLPVDASDNRSITYTISSTNPPRAANTLIQLPKAEEIRPLPERTIDVLTNRSLAGEYLTALSFSNPNISGDSKKQFEIGQVLEFESEALPVLNNTFIPDEREFSQSTNILSGDLPITEEERENIHNTATTQFNDLTDKLNGLNQDISNNEILISNAQKSINETRKAINSLSIVFEGETNNDIITRLEISLEVLIQERDDLVSATNILSTDAEDTYNEMLKIREFVR
jgi:hypothetical protein